LFGTPMSGWLAVDASTITKKLDHSKRVANAGVRSTHT